MSDLKKRGPEGNEERAGKESVSAVQNKGNQVEAQPVVDSGAECATGHWEGDAEKIVFVKE